jgi:hypothetical protein
MEGTSSAEPVVNKYPGLKQAIGNLNDNPEVIVDVKQPEVVVVPKPGDANYVAPVQTTEVKEEAKVETPVIQSKKIDFSTLTEEERNEALAELTGGKIKTFAELNPIAPKTAEEIAEEKEQRKNEALAWALENKKVTKADYDKKNTELSKSDREIALSLFTASQQAEDKDLTAEECEEIFIDTYHESEDASDRLQKIGQKEIAKLAASYRKENGLPDFESEYEGVLQTQGQYKAYKGIVKEAASELPKELSFSLDYEAEKGKGTEKLTYTFPVDQKMIDKIITEYSSGKEFSVRNIESNGKIDKKAILNEMHSQIKARLFDTIIPEMLAKNAEDVGKAVMAKVKNIPVQKRELNDGRQNINTGTPKIHERNGLHAAIERQN